MDCSEACEKGDLELFKSLYLKEDFSELGEYFSLACKGGNVEIAKLIFSCCPVSSSELRWGMIYACQQGHLNVVKFVLEKDSHKPRIGLWDACQTGQSDVVKFLIEQKGFSSSLNNNEMSYACIPFYRQNICNNSIRMRKQFQTIKVLINKECSEWSLPFQWNIPFVESLSYDELKQYHQKSLFPQEVLLLVKKRLYIIHFLGKNMFPVLNKSLREKLFS